MKRIKCEICGSVDDYYPTHSGVARCTMCEEWLSVGSSPEEIKDDLKIALQKIDQLEKDKQELIDCNKNIISAWESLQGGCNQPVRAIERWLISDMGPAINKCRELDKSIEELLK